MSNVRRKPSTWMRSVDGERGRSVGEGDGGGLQHRSRSDREWGMMGGRDLTYLVEQVEETPEEDLWSEDPDIRVEGDEKRAEVRERVLRNGAGARRALFVVELV